MARPFPETYTEKHLIRRSNTDLGLFQARNMTRRRKALYEVVALSTKKYRVDDVVGEMI